LDQLPPHTPLLHPHRCSYRFLMRLCRAVGRMKRELARGATQRDRYKGGPAPAGAREAREPGGPFSGGSGKRHDMQHETTLPRLPRVARARERRRARPPCWRVRGGAPLRGVLSARRRLGAVAGAAQVERIHRPDRVPLSHAPPRALCFVLTRLSLCLRTPAPSSAPAASLLQLSSQPAWGRQDHAADLPGRVLAVFTKEGKRVHVA
jgi:hypothetical protein